MSFVRSWLPTVSLSLAAFIFVTSEFIPVGLLTEIAQGFGRTNADTGLMMTIYAWIVALASVPFTAFAGRMNRRPLMLSLIGLFVLAHALSAVAWSFEVLVVSRALVASTHAIFWAVAIPLGVRLAPPGNREKATAVVATGATLGGVLGIPLSTILGQAMSWREAFGSIGIAAGVIGLVLLRLLPSTPAIGATRLRDVGILLKRPTLLAVYMITIVMMTGHYTVFTFISPFLLEIGGARREVTAFALLVFGCAGLLGGFVAPRMMKVALKSSWVITPMIVALCLVGLGFAVRDTMSTMALLIVWGSTFMVFALILQNLVLVLAPDAQDLAMAAYSGLYNVGIGGGALIGSISSTHHLGSISFVAAGIITLAGLLAFGLLRTGALSRIAAVLLALAISLPATELHATTSSPSEPVLEIQVREKTHAYTRSELLKSSHRRSLTIANDVAYKGPRTFEVVPLWTLFEKEKLQDDDTLLFRSLDGFSAPLDTKRILNRDPKKAVAYLAIEPANAPWPKLKGGKSPSAGPFYLVWENASASKIGPEEWPFQLTTFSVEDSVAKKFPETLPKNASAKIRAGYELFLQNCFACHTLNGAGTSQLGPDLNLPLSPTEYLKAGMLARLIRDPQSLRRWPDSRMPAFDRAKISDDELSSLVAYLEHMARTRR